VQAEAGKNVHTYRGSGWSRFKAYQIALKGSFVKMVTSKIWIIFCKKFKEQTAQFVVLKFFDNQKQEKKSKVKNVRTEYIVGSVCCSNQPANNLSLGCA
jgi:hypothetical protein